MAVESFANNFGTTLAAPMLVGDLTATVTAAAPAALQVGQFRIVIGAEILLVTAGADTTTWTVTRGVEGTTPAAHAGGATVTHVLTAASLLNGVIDVRAFGAVGDGMTDDGPAFTLRLRRPIPTARCTFRFRRRRGGSRRKCRCSALRFGARATLP